MSPNPLEYDENATLGASHGTGAEHDDQSEQGNGERGEDLIEDAQVVEETPHTGLAVTNNVIEEAEVLDSGDDEAGQNNQPEYEQPEENYTLEEAFVDNGQQDPYKPIEKIIDCRHYDPNIGKNVIMILRGPHAAIRNDSENAETWVATSDPEYKTVDGKRVADDDIYSTTIYDAEGYDPETSVPLHYFPGQIEWKLTKRPYQLPLSEPYPAQGQAIPLAEPPAIKAPAAKLPKKGTNWGSIAKWTILATGVMAGIAMFKPRTWTEKDAEALRNEYKTSKQIAEENYAKTKREMTARVLDKESVILSFRNNTGTLVDTIRQDDLDKGAYLNVSKVNGSWQYGFAGDEKKPNGIVEHSFSGNTSASELKKIEKVLKPRTDMKDYKVFTGKPSP